MAGLTSLPRKKNIKGQPHKLAYITEAESDLLKSMGGAGKPRKGTKGVPSYDFADYDDIEGEAAEAEAAAAEEAAAEAESEEDSRGVGYSEDEEFDQIQDPGMFAGDFADVAGLPGVDLGPMAGIDAYAEGYYDLETGQTKTDAQYAMDILNELNQKGMTTTAQDLLNARAFTGLGIPEMNKLEEQNLKTFGLGYRGPFEARSPQGLDRDEYDPNSLTGAGTDQSSTNKSLFAEFAKENPSLTAVEALTEYNAKSSPDNQLSITDVQSMGFELNAPVGPQADFREAEAQRGLAQGIGFGVQTAIAGSPIGVISDIALSGTGKGVLGHTIDAVEKATGFELPELPDVIPSYQETAVDFFGPAQDTMAPGSFGIGSSSATGIAAPTDTDIGFTGPTDVYDYGIDGPQQMAPPPVEKPVIKEKEEVIETPAPSFPVRDTTPPSRISRIANIYNISEDAAKRMLGVA